MAGRGCADTGTAGSLDRHKHRTRRRSGSCWAAPDVGTPRGVQDAPRGGQLREEVGLRALVHGNEVLVAQVLLRPMGSRGLMWGRPAPHWSPFDLHPLHRHPFYLSMLR